MTSKRNFDLAFAIPGLILMSPLMIAIAIWIRLDSHGPIIFRQTRIGRGGVPFNIFKFRTMFMRSEANDPVITKTSDARITRCGKAIRKLKIDELPQLMNVMLGDMSIVGPRPEVKKYVDMYPKVSRESILSVRPGITDNTAILFRNEGDLLALADDPEREYIEKILPRKISMYEDYVENQTLTGDLILILKTVFSVTLH